MFLKIGNSNRNLHRSKEEIDREFQHMFGKKSSVPVNRGLNRSKEEIDRDLQHFFGNKSSVSALQSESGYSSFLSAPVKLKTFLQIPLENSGVSQSNYNFPADSYKRNPTNAYFEKPTTSAPDVLKRFCSLEELAQNNHKPIGYNQWFLNEKPKSNLVSSSNSVNDSMRNSSHLKNKSVNKLKDNYNIEDDFENIDLYSDVDELSIDSVSPPKNFNLTNKESQSKADNLISSTKNKLKNNVSILNTTSVNEIISSKRKNFNEIQDNSNSKRRKVVEVTNEREALPKKGSQSHSAVCQTDKINENVNLTFDKPVSMNEVTRNSATESFFDASVEMEILNSDSIIQKARQNNTNSKTNNSKQKEIQTAQETKKYPLRTIGKNKRNLVATNKIGSINNPSTAKDGNRSNIKIVGKSNSLLSEGDLWSDSEINPLSYSADESLYDEEPDKGPEDDLSTSYKCNSRKLRSKENSYGNSKDSNEHKKQISNVSKTNDFKQNPKHTKINSDSRSQVNTELSKTFKSSGKDRINSKTQCNTSVMSDKCSIPSKACENSVAGRLRSNSKPELNSSLPMENIQSESTRTELKAKKSSTQRNEDPTIGSDEENKQSQLNSTIMVLRSSNKKKTPAEKSSRMLQKDQNLDKPKVTNAEKQSNSKNESETKNSNESKKDDVSLSNWIIRLLKKERILVEGNFGVTDNIWRSTYICKRITAKKLMSYGNRVYHLNGNLNLKETVKADVPSPLAKKFMRGFPQNWKTLISNHFQQHLEVKSRKHCEPEKLSKDDKPVRNIKPDETSQATENKKSGERKSPRTNSEPLVSGRPVRNRTSIKNKVSPKLNSSINNNKKIEKNKTNKIMKPIKNKKLNKNNKPDSNTIINKKNVNSSKAVKHDKTVKGKKPIANKSTESSMALIPASSMKDNKSKKKQDNTTVALLPVVQLSNDLNSLPRSRSGRIIIPPLAYWANQRIVPTLDGTYKLVGFDEPVANSENSVIQANDKKTNRNSKKNVKESKVSKVIVQNHQIKKGNMQYSCQQIDYSEEIIRNNSQKNSSSKRADARKGKTSSLSKNISQHQNDHKLLQRTEQEIKSKDGKMSKIEQTSLYQIGKNSRRSQRLSKTEIEICKNGQNIKTLHTTAEETTESPNKIEYRKQIMVQKTDVSKCRSNTKSTRNSKSASDFTKCLDFTSNQGLKTPTLQPPKLNKKQGRKSQSNQTKRLKKGKINSKKSQRNLSICSNNDESLVRRSSRVSLMNSFSENKRNSLENITLQKPNFKKNATEKSANSKNRKRSAGLVDNEDTGRCKDKTSSVSKKYNKKQKKSSNIEIKKNSNQENSQDNEPRAKPVITAAKGTLKRRQQLRDFLAHENENFEADIFDVVPKQNRPVIPNGILKEEESEEESCMKTPTFPPGYHSISAFYPASDKSTPNTLSSISPGLLLEEPDWKEVDCYLHKRRKKGQGPIRSKKPREHQKIRLPKRPKTFSSEVNGELFTCEVVSEDDRDEEEEEDHYFSSDVD